MCVSVLQPQILQQAGAPHCMHARMSAEGSVLSADEKLSPVRWEPRTRHGFQESRGQCSDPAIRETAEEQGAMEEGPPEEIRPPGPQL